MGLLFSGQKLRDSLDFPLQSGHALIECRWVMTSRINANGVSPHSPGSPRASNVSQTAHPGNTMRKNQNLNEVSHLLCVLQRRSQAGQVSP
jgi:hypothetical protein